MSRSCSDSLDDSPLTVLVVQSFTQSFVLFWVCVRALLILFFGDRILLVFSSTQVHTRVKASPWLPQPNDNIVSDLKSGRWLNKLYCRYGNTGLFCLLLRLVCVVGQKRKCMRISARLHLIMCCTVYCIVVYVLSAEQFPCVYDP